MRAGDFLLPGTCLLKLYGQTSRLGDRAIAVLHGYARTGPMRKRVQDPEYPITQLNQLAARVLSRGIDDPGTAMTCVDWFSMAVAQIVDRDMPGKVFLVASNVPVLISLVDSLILLAELTALEDRLSCIAQQGRLLSETTECGKHMNDDLADFRQRYQKLVRIAGRKAC